MNRLTSGASPNREHAIAAAVARFDDGRFAGDLRRRIAVRTESQRAESRKDLAEYLTSEMMPALATLGCSSHV